MNLIPKISNVKSNVLLAIIILVGTALRLYDITSVSLWHDEAFSALLIRYPFGEMIDRIILDVHPPLYYIILRIWDIIFGDSLLSLRLYSVLFSVLTIYFTYLFINIAFNNEKLSLISAAFIAINPFQIQYATEARMYSLGTFLLVFSSWLLVKAIKSCDLRIKNRSKNACNSSFDKCDWLSTLADEKFAAKNKFNKIYIKLIQYKWWILYGISAALAIYTHYYLIFSIAAQALFLFFWAYKKYGLKIEEWLKSKNIKGAIIAYAVSFILYLPWLPVLIKQLGQVEENYWIPSMDRYSIPTTIFHIFTGINIYTGHINLLIIFIAFIAILIYSIKKEENNYKWLIIFSFLIPFIISIALSFKRSLYLDRYFVFVGLFYMVILTIFIRSIKYKLLRHTILSILLIGSMLFFIKGWKNIEPDNKPGMAGATEYMFKHILPEDKVYVNTSYIYFTYKYYAYRNYFGNNGYSSNFNPSETTQDKNVFENIRLYPEYMTPLLYTPSSFYSEMPHFSGTALLTENDTINDLNKNIRRGEYIWIVWTTGFESAKPDVPQNWMQVDEKKVEDVLGYRGWIGVTKYKIQ